MDIPENNSFFKKLGLIKTATFDLSMSAEEFKDKFKSKVSPGDYLFGFSSHDKEFDGSIKNETFEIGRTSKFYASEYASVSGSYNDNGGKLSIEIDAYVPILTVSLYLVITYLIGIIALVQIDFEDKWPLIIITTFSFLLFPAHCLYGFNRSTKRVLKFFEREFKKW